MQTTEEFFGIDPKHFKGMAYEKVLEIKRKASQDAYDDAAELYFKLPLNKKAEEKAKQANAEMVKHKKALDVINMWIKEME